jgi:hypothetical protein
MKGRRLIGDACVFFTVADALLAEAWVVVPGWPTIFKIDSSKITTIKIRMIILNWLSRGKAIGESIDCDKV